MQVNTRFLGSKGSCLIPGHEHAERELTLSEIDSLLHNGEINRDEAISMAVSIAGKNIEVLKAIFPAK